MQGALDDIYRDELLWAGLPSTGQYVLVVEPGSGADVADDVSFGFTPTIDETFSQRPYQLNERVDDRIEIPGRVGSV